MSVLPVNILTAKVAKLALQLQQSSGDQREAVTALQILPD
jgi:hypothetical protein